MNIGWLRSWWFLKSSSQLRFDERLVLRTRHLDSLELLIKIILRLHHQDSPGDTKVMLADVSCLRMGVYHLSSLVHRRCSFWPALPEGFYFGCFGTESCGYRHLDPNPTVYSPLLPEAPNQ